LREKPRELNRISSFSSVYGDYIANFRWIIMDHIIEYYSLWKRSFMDLLFITIVKVAFVWKVGSFCEKLFVCVYVYVYVYFLIYYFIVPR